VYSLFNSTDFVVVEDVCCCCLVVVMMREGKEF
jgi:hypothetical protein